MTQAAARTDKILVVDDDARIRDLLRRYLTQEGFEVILAEDGKALNRLMLRETADLIVLDLMMPGEDGLSICRRLRAANDRTPIIMLTAKGEDVDRIVGLTAVDPALVDLAREHRLVVSVEDNGVQGGCGASLLQALVAAGVRTPVQLHGIPKEFLGHAKRDVILERIGLTAQHLARGIVEAMAGDLAATDLPSDPQVEDPARPEVAGTPGDRSRDRRG